MNARRGQARADSSQLFAALMSVGELTPVALLEHFTEGAQELGEGMHELLLKHDMKRGGAVAIYMALWCAKAVVVHCSVQ